MMEEKPYVDVIQEWFKRIGYTPRLYQCPTPVRGPCTIKLLTQRERERVDSLSKERGYRRFHPIATVL